MSVAESPSSGMGGGGASFCMQQNPCVGALDIHETFPFKLVPGIKSDQIGIVTQLGKYSISKTL